MRLYGHHDSGAIYQLVCCPVCARSKTTRRDQVSLSHHEKIGVNVVLLGREDLRALQISRKRRSEVCVLERPQVRGHGRIRGADFGRGDSEVCPAQAAARNEFLIYRDRLETIRLHEHTS